MPCKPIQSLPPPPPEKPDPYECCGSGCTPCIYDYYYEQLEQWEIEHGVSLTQYTQKIAELGRQSKEG